MTAVCKESDRRSLIPRIHPSSCVDARSSYTVTQPFFEPVTQAALGFRAPTERSTADRSVERTLKLTMKAPILIPHEMCGGQANPQPFGPGIGAHRADTRPCRLYSLLHRRPGRRGGIGRTHACAKSLQTTVANSDPFWWTRPGAFPTAPAK